MKKDQLTILIGCEHSSIVKNEFLKLGFKNTFSCDLIESPNMHNHFVCDVLKLIPKLEWDLAIFFPPCTYLCSSGLHWNNKIEGRKEKTEQSLFFVNQLLNSDIKHIALENPIGCINTKIRKPDQIIQPYEYGEDASKRTCLWLKNLPLLSPTNFIPGREVNGKKRWSNQTDSGQNILGPSKDRGKIRGLTYKGVAKAMAEQWGEFIIKNN